jgi:pimeloyl-ACP methyl ester carboxylesterase
MDDRINFFRSPMLESQFFRAYEAVLQQWPIPYEELMIPTRFGETHLIASGPKEAPSVVLLPPGGTYAPIWIRNVGPLSQFFRVYAVDIIGEMNKSVPTRPILKHREFMEWMADLFDGLHIKKANLVGNSNGGFFVLETALYLPERVNKVVLISPAATFVQMWAFWFHVFIPSYFIAPLIGSEKMVLNAYDWLWQGFPGEDCFMQLKSISKVAGKGFRTSINRTVPRVFRDDELRKIKAPLLLLIGDHEVIYRPEAVIRRATQLVPDLKAEMVPNANHSAQYTAPDFVNAKMVEFLQV